MAELVAQLTKYQFGELVPPAVLIYILVQPSSTSICQQIQTSFQLTFLQQGMLVFVFSGVKTGENVKNAERPLNKAWASNRRDRRSRPPLRLTHRVKPTLLRIDNFERRINQQYMLKNMQGNAFFISVNFFFFLQRNASGQALCAGMDTNFQSKIYITKQQQQQNTPLTKSCIHV